MQSTTRFHDGIANPILQEADSVFHDSVAFHPTNGVFNTDSDGGNTPIGRFLRWGEFTPTGFFLGLKRRHTGQEESLESRILIETTTGWQRIARQIRDALIMRPAFIGSTQKANMTGLSDHEEVFERVTLLLATVVFVLLFGIGRALNRTFGAIMPKRGVVELPSVVYVSNMSANAVAVRAGSSSWSSKA